MENFSKETFLKIISHLHLHDKLQCILVCKQWKQLIQDTILYRELNFSNTDTFNQAFELFADTDKFGEQVNQLQVQDCTLDTFTILTLPDVFYNLKNLIWISQHPSLNINLPRKPIYLQQFKKWNQMEHIQSLTLEYNPLPIYILEASQLFQLKTLDIQFVTSSTFDDFQQAVPYSQNLINCLKNAPCLTNLTLGNISASTIDLDILHKNLPNLNTLILKTFCLVDSNISNTLTLQTNLQHLHVYFNHLGYRNLKEKVFDTAIQSFLSYIYIKYNLLQTLSVKFDDEFQLMPLVHSLEGYLVNILSHSIYLTCYKMRVCPITDIILDTMDKNQIKLKTIQVWLEEFDMLRQFNFLLSSQQKNFISNLKIIDTLHWSRPIPNDSSILRLITELTCLTVLDLRCQPKTLNYSFGLLINILTQLDKLKSLSIQSLYDDLSITDITLNTQQIKQTNISTLELDVIDASYKSRPEYINAIFQYTLLACPNLKIFHLYGDLQFEKFGRISLDFTNHKQLKELWILLNNVSYYTFDKRKNRQPCIPYKNIGQKMNLGSMEVFKNTFYIELLWNEHTICPYLIDAEVMSNSQMVF